METRAIGGVPLTKVEEIDFNRFLERYFLEMESGKINSGNGKRYVSPIGAESASKYFFDNYVNQVYYQKNYSFPYAGTKDQIDNAMKLVPKENQTLFGYGRSSNDWKADEIVYREAFNDLNSKHHLPETGAELLQEMSNAVVAIRGGKVSEGGKFNLSIKNRPNVSYIAQPQGFYTGKSYDNFYFRVNNPYSPFLEKDIHGNEIYYRTMSRPHFEQFMRTGKVPPTKETFISPLSNYSNSYDGVLVKFTTKAGTSLRLQNIGVSGNYGTKQKVFPDMPRASKGWATNNQAQFKLEGVGKFNHNQGVVNTGLGQTEGLKIFNENILEYKVIKKEDK